MWVLVALTVYLGGAHAEILREFDDMTKCSTALTALSSGKSRSTTTKTWYVCLPMDDAAEAQLQPKGVQVPEGTTK